MHTRPRVAPRGSTLGNNNMKLEFLFVLWDICTFRYMYMWLGYFWIHVLLDTFGYICTFGDMYIDISLINERYISICICSSVSKCSCVNLLCWFVCFIYYLWMHYVKIKNYCIFKGFNELTTCTLIGYLIRNCDFGWSLQVKSKLFLM